MKELKAEEMLKNVHSFLDDSLGRCYERIEVLAAMEEYKSQSANKIVEMIEKDITKLKGVILIETTPDEAKNIYNAIIEYLEELKQQILSEFGSKEVCPGCGTTKFIIDLRQNGQRRCVLCFVHWENPDTLTNKKKEV